MSKQVEIVYRKDDSVVETIPAESWPKAETVKRNLDKTLDDRRYYSRINDPEWVAGQQVKEGG